MSQPAAPAARADRHGGLSTEAMILQVSTDLFTSLGFDRVTTRRIAEACNITVPTIYLYFKDKRALYVRCCMVVWARHRPTIEAELTRPGSADERIFRGARALAAALLDDPQLGMMFQRELVESDEEGRRMVNGDSFRIPLGLFNRAIAEAEPEAPPMTGLSIFALTFGLYQHTLVTDEVGRAIGDGPDRADRFAGHVLRMVTPQVHARLFALGRA